jgi:hypothetical protein
MIDEEQICDDDPSRCWPTPLCGEFGMNSELWYRWVQYSHGNNQNPVDGTLPKIIHADFFVKNEQDKLLRLLYKQLLHLIIFCYRNKLDIWLSFCTCFSSKKQKFEFLHVYFCFRLSFLYLYVSYFCSFQIFTYIHQVWVSCNIFFSVIVYVKEQIFVFVFDYLLFSSLAVSRPTADSFLSLR